MPERHKDEQRSDTTVSGHWRREHPEHRFAYTRCDGRRANCNPVAMGLADDMYPLERCGCANPADYVDSPQQND